MVTAIESRSSANIANPPDWLLRYFLGFGANTHTGRRVTEHDALSAVPVFSCVRILAETIASLPLFVYKHLPDGGKQRDVQHPLYRLLHDQPNPLMTAMAFRETLVGHCALWGNGYAEIEQNGHGRPLALWPLRPDRMRVSLTMAPPPDDPAGVARRTLRYHYTTDTGEVTLREDQVLHVPGLGFDGIQGYSVIQMGREAVGMTLATEEFGARFFGNGSSVSGVLTHPGRLSPQAHERLKADWDAMHSGLSSAHRVAVLEEGVTWQQTGIPPEDAQFLQTRNFQIEEIARLFRIPEWMLGAGAGQRVMRGTMEQESIGFVTYTLLPWLERIEQVLQRDLLAEQEKSTWFIEHLVDGLMRGDLLSRYQAYAVGRQNGWLKVNDIRFLENMNPVPPNQGGDVLLAPLNMVPLDTLVGAPAKPTVKNPTPTAGSGPLSGDQNKSLRLLLGEARDRSAVTRRRQLAQGYRRLLVDAGDKVLRRERDRVLGQAEKFLTTRDAVQFYLWLEDFYRDHAEYVARQYQPVLASLADAVAPAAAEQIGASSDTGELDEFVRKLADAQAWDWTMSSRGQVGQIVSDATGANTDPIQALSDRLDEWDATRARKVADIWVVRGDNAVSKETWRRGGIQTVRWMGRGEDCAYCGALDGNEMPIATPFVTKNQDFQPDGADSPLRPGRDIGHGPLHEGCSCSIEPV